MRDLPINFDPEPLTLLNIKNYYYGQFMRSCNLLASQKTS